MIDVSAIDLPDEFCWIHDVDEAGDPEATCWLREGTRPLATILTVLNGFMVVPETGNLVHRVATALTPAEAWKRAAA